MTNKAFFFNILAPLLRLHLSIVIFLPIILYAQEKEVRFHHIGIEDGLPQNMVDCILQDSQGFMWFGTWNGLSKYDGYQFEIYDNESHGINNFIYTLHEDQAGNIWLGTREGLFRYLYDKKQFERIRLRSAEFTEPITVNTLEAGWSDDLLVGTNKGLYFIELGDNEYTIRKHIGLGPNSDVIPGTNIKDIMIDRQSRIWAGTDEGVTILSMDGKIQNHFVQDPLNGLSSNLITCFSQSDDGDIWIGTENGLNEFQPITQSFIQYFHDEQDEHSLAHNNIMDLKQDRHGNIIIATLGGLSILDESSKSCTNYQEDAYAFHSLNNEFVNCLYIDKRENIWIGTERGGVNFFNQNQNIFEHFEVNIADPNSLNHGTVNSIYEDEQYIWIGTAGGGLNRYEKQTGTYIHFTFSPQDDQSISSDFITAIHRDPDGRLWIGTWGGGLNLLMQNRQSAPYFRRYTNQEIPGERSMFISSICDDPGGGLWIGSLEGLYHYSLRDREFKRYLTDMEKNITEVGCVLSNYNELWVGTRKGLFQITDPLSESHQIRKYQHIANEPGSISGNYVISLLMDARGDLWVGTYGNGLNRFDRDHRTFISVSTLQGLSNNIVYSIQEDPEHNLWFSTDYGLSRFNPQTEQVRNYFMADGLLNNQYYWSASFKNREGKMYFGGMKGMDAFFPEWINDEQSSPEVVLTNISLINGPVSPFMEYHGVQVIDQDISKAEYLCLSHKEKILNLEFSQLDFFHSRIFQYAYIMEGFEKDWNYVPADRRFATYTNLTPGDYVFKVKSSNANGEFTSEPRRLAIHINTPFWATTWFNLMSFLLLTGMVFAYIRFRMYTLKKQKVMLAKQVAERTEQINQQKEALAHQAVQLKQSNDELQRKQALIQGQNDQLEKQNWEILAQRDELIDLNKKLQIASQSRLNFFTNISHEFRTPLSLIMGPIEKLLEDKGLRTEVRQSLTAVNKSAMRILNLINQFLYIRKVEKMGYDLNVTKGNIGQFCQEIYDAFKPLEQTKNIELQFVKEELPNETWYDTEKLGNVIYNLMSNAFKYTLPGGKIILRAYCVDQKCARPLDPFSVSTDNLEVRIEVEDTGVGISAENKPHVFDRFFRATAKEDSNIEGSGIGLSLTKELVQAHHGQIFLESTLGKGSMFSIQIPINKSAYKPEELANKPGSEFGVKKQVATLLDRLSGSVENEGLAKDVSYQFTKNRPTVLVIEDNQDLRKFIASRINEVYNVLEAVDGKEGVHIAKIENPDLIVSDIMMPNVDGLELCAEIKNHLDTSHIPIILLTAKSAIDDQIEGLEIGADDYLPKPFSFDLLFARIANLLESRNRLRLHYLNANKPDPNDITTNSKDGQFIEKAIQIVHDNLDNGDFKVNDFIKAMGVSRSLLHKKLAALTNQSTTEFINHIRLKQAAQLLKANELNISEVAYAVGYNDPKYFSRVFSKHFGQSPKSYAESTINPLQN